jgi:murein DD-endopeptidase MepM/ murein hydrolase activator NlpD
VSVRPPRAASVFPALAIFGSLVAVAGAYAGEPAEKVFQTRQGDVFYLTLNVEGEPSSVQGRFRDRLVPFFKTGREGEFGALVGVDMADAPDTGDLKAEVRYPDGARKRVFRVVVAPEDFREQRMTLPKDQVDPDAAALKRIALEKEKVKAVLAGFTPERLWGTGFLVPVEGTATGAFGGKRILNDQPRNQHSGEDIAASLGAPVKATNDGIVRMVDEHFFSGKGVILDHGLGLFTMYFHLDAAAVKEGERVKRGGVIGTVGQSGRATGPHLHWGAWLNGARVNPFALTRLLLSIPTTKTEP